MRRNGSVMAALVVAMTVVVAGCSAPPDKNVARKDSSQKPKTVVINKGMNKKQEENLNKRLDKLEEKVKSQDDKDSRSNASELAKSSQPEQPQTLQAEDQVRAAAEAYYQAVSARNWGYTYDLLASAPTATASASPSASASASASPSATPTNTPSASPNPSPNRNNKANR